MVSLPASDRTLDRDSFPRDIDEIDASTTDLNSRSSISCFDVYTSNPVRQDECLDFIVRSFVDSSQISQTADAFEKYSPFIGQVFVLYLADQIPEIAELPELTTNSESHLREKMKLVFSPVSYTHLTLPTICSV